MALRGGSSSRRRILSLHVQTPPPPLDECTPATTATASHPQPQQPAGQRGPLPPPPKSPLHGARAASRGGSGGSDRDAAMSGFDRMLLLRNMNVAAVNSDDHKSTKSVAKPPVGVTSSASDEVSAAHNLKQRKQQETRRRAETQRMAMEDYVGTPEGDARLRRQDERARMQEEELHTQRLVQFEKVQRRAEQLKLQQDEENRQKEMYLEKRRLAMEEQARVAQEKEMARRQALESKMKALKEEADRRAREEYVARQQQLAAQAQMEQDARAAEMESAHMRIEDEMAAAMRVEWAAAEERRRQIEEEALQWKLFEEREALRQKEETQLRREAQKQQYELDRARRMQIHKLQQDRERAAAEKKRRQHEQEVQQHDQQQKETSGVSVPLLPLLVRTVEESLSVACQLTARGVTMTSQETSRISASVAMVGGGGMTVRRTITEQMPFVPPPPVLPALADKKEKKEEIQEEKTEEETDQVEKSEETEEEEDEKEAEKGEGDKQDKQDKEIMKEDKEEVETGEEDKEEKEEKGWKTMKEEENQEITDAQDGDGDKTSRPPSSPVVGGDTTERDPHPNLSSEPSIPEEAPTSATERLATDPESPLPSSDDEGPAAAEKPQHPPPTEDRNSTTTGAVVASELLSLDALRRDGVVPVAEVLSVVAGSPAATAGLLPRDLLVAFGGITSATPKCLLAIAECVQQSVDQRVTLSVLRTCSLSESASESEPQVQQCELWLVPCKWKGKGLLGCQLSPFKWPIVAEVALDNGSTGQGSDAASESSSSSSYDALVLYQVEPNSLAHRLGLLDGDVLARCGELELSRDASAGDLLLSSVAAYLQSHWRDAQREQSLTIQRWDAAAQIYVVLQLVLPPPADSEPLGCSLTTYSQYYDISVTTAQCSSPTACDECYYTQLATSLHAAALNGHIACLDALSATCSAELLDWRDDDGRSPLFYACYAQQMDAVRWLATHLLAMGAPYDPLTGGDAYGDSPLHAAAASDQVDALALLLESKYIRDVNLPNAMTQATAAHVAASEVTLRVLKDTYNADMLVLDSDGRMPLFYACLRQDHASVSYLSALHPEFVDYADGAGGNTPLHMAAWCGYGDIVRILVQYLPSIALFVPNQDGLDARTLAERSGWDDIAQELEQWMASSTQDV